MQINRTPQIWPSPTNEIKNTNDSKGKSPLEEHSNQKARGGEYPRPKMTTDIRTGMAQIQSLKSPHIIELMGESGLFSSSRSKASSSSQGGESSTIPLSAFAVVQKDINSEDICAGLSAEWLRMKTNGSASSRIDALDYGTSSHATAKQRSVDYHQALRRSANDGDDYPLLEANKYLLKEANLKMSSSPKTIFVHGHRDEGVKEVSSKITKNNSSYLLSLRFDNLTGHAIACSSKDGQVHLFDPNQGEFECERKHSRDLISGLFDYYQNHNMNIYSVNLFGIK